MGQDSSRGRIIKSWLSGKPVDFPAPVAPKGFAVSQNPSGLHQESIPSGERLSDVVGNVYGLTYSDANGDESRRRIKISHVDYVGDTFYVGAYCFERQAYRTFRIDRMMELVNMRTGEVHDSAMDWCRGLIATGSAEEMMRMCIHDLNILGLLARCDGHLHEQEIAFMVEHVLDVLGYPPKANAKAMSKVADAIYPDENRLEKSLLIARRASADSKRRLLNSARRIVDADEVLAEAEFDVARQIELAFS